MASYTLNPAGDVSFSNTYWTATTGNDSWWDQIVVQGTGVGDATNDGTYVETTDTNQPMRVSFGSTPANTSEVTAITFNVRARITDAGSTAVMEGSAYHSTSTQIGSTIDVSGTALGGYGSFGSDSSTWTWSSLTLNKTQADSLEFEIRFAAA